MTLEIQVHAWDRHNCGGDNRYMCFIVYAHQIVYISYPVFSVSDLGYIVHDTEYM
jgi:hypothetical protein